MSVPAATTLDQFNINGRSAIITGAGSGIGLAFAETMVEAGVAVTLADIDLSSVQRLAERLCGDGRTPRAVALDIADAQGVADTFNGHVAAFGGCDIVFANAGISPGDGFWNQGGFRNEDSQIDTFDTAIWDRVMAVNLTGAFHTLREAARVMKQAGRGGSIIVTSSNAAFRPLSVVCSPYAPSKAAVSHLVRQVALELADYQIRVNSIAPGPFVTNIADGVLSDPAVREAWRAVVPIGRLGDTRQLKPLALFLASDASGHMTGAEIVIDGGTSLGHFR